MKPFFEIKGRKIGYDFNPLVIAEIGINHEGSLKTALEMVDAAYAAGAEIIKHQTHIVSDEMAGAARKTIPGNATVSIYDIMERCALNEEEEYEMMRYTESKGMIFISTPFSRAAAERLKKFDIPAYKIGSGECNNYPLFEHVASFGKPIILSTGMNTIESVEKAVNILGNTRCPLHFCIVPMYTLHHPELVRLGGMNELEQHFPDAVVGLSDHTLNNYACLGAVAVGASILERHFTDSMDRPGPDIICSMDTKAMKELIEGSKILKLERGGHKGPVKEEQPTIDFAFATVVAIKDIQAGDAFTKENIWVKRPGTGEIPAERYNELFELKATQFISSDTQIEWSHTMPKNA